MDMLLISNVLVIEAVRANKLLAMRSPEKCDEIALEVVAEALYMFAGIFADQLHLADVRLALGVALEPVCIATLFLAGPKGGRTESACVYNHIRHGVSYWQNHLNLWSPLLFIWFATCLVLPISARGIV